MALLSNVLRQLRKEKDRAAKEVMRLESAIMALTGLGGGRDGAGRGRTARARTGRRRISAAGRRRIAAAQRARWAKIKAKKAKKTA